MKLLVFSDSHGTLSTMMEAVRRESPDHILHLGDYHKDAEAIAARFPIPLTSVPGNCDGACGTAPIQVLTFYEKRIFMTHGHLHGVKMHYQRLLYAGLEAQADLVLFGHTHRPECFRERGLWVMNPGACGAHGTYGVVEITPDHLTCQVRA